MMPPKKRTNQSKHMPPTSPTTSTFHDASDHHQHQHIRHPGPSINTRAGVSATSKDPHEKRLLAEVPPPGARISFTKFMYVLLFSAMLFLGWYLYGMVTLLGRLKEEVGWWGIILGDSSGGITRWGPRWADEGVEAGKDGDLEASLNALANVLGISPIQVASAVKSVIPQARMTSIASKVAETGASDAVRVLLEHTGSMGRAGATTFMDELKGAAEEDIGESMA